MNTNDTNDDAVLLVAASLLEITKDLILDSIVQYVTLHKHLQMVGLADTFPR